MPLALAPVTHDIARVRKPVLIYGIVGGLLIALLQGIEFRYLVMEHSVAIYGGIVAAIFSAVGLWLGLKLTKTRETIVVREVEVRVEVPASVDFSVDEAKRDALGITRRELEILELIASGLSTREIAERVFLSENTVKTHSSRVFDKLGAKRRTQAVQIGRELRLIR